MLFIGYLVFKRQTCSHSQEKIFKITSDKKWNNLKKKQILFFAKLLFKYYEHRLKRSLRACSLKHEALINKQM